MPWRWYDPGMTEFQRVTLELLRALDWDIVGAVEVRQPNGYLHFETADGRCHAVDRQGWVVWSFPKGEFWKRDVYPKINEQLRMMLLKEKGVI